jgi:hypothetical protein
MAPALVPAIHFPNQAMDCQPPNHAGDYLLMEIGGLHQVRERDWF